MRTFLGITKILFIAVAISGVWQGLENGDSYRILLNCIVGMWWLSRL